MTWQIGVDIGGTFIDFCAHNDNTQALHTIKVLTTPDNPGAELRSGLEELETRHQVAPSDTIRFVHGTTVGINTIIQKKGAKLALITNAGFEDVLELGRLRMPDMYSLFCSSAEPLIPRDRIFGISGRMTAQGTEGAPLNLTELQAIATTCRNDGVDGVIISMLHAYQSPMHEDAVKAEITRLAPDLFAFTSSEIWPVVREYERSTTAILNGYVHPRVAGYLGGLETTLKELGVPARPLLSKSNGGLMQAETGKRNCVSMLLSGTASGVTGASWLARQAGVDRVLTLDIGGTSADVALIIDGQPQFGKDERIGDYPLHIPSVSVSSIGIGGGSVAHVDAFGVLNVGPESAGSTPGPACYGQGGTRATLTDALAVCGYLGHAPMAYGQLTLDMGRAFAVIDDIAQKLGRDGPATAEAIIRVAVSEIFVEVEKLASRAGIDLRDYTLMPFGGGGPMLGAMLARDLGMRHVLVPHRPGVVSALGGLVSDLKGDFVRALFVPCSATSVELLQQVTRELIADGHAWLYEKQGFEADGDTLISAEMRYAGQSFEVDVPLKQDWIVSGDIAAIRNAFDQRHQELFDFNDPKAEAEIVNLCLIATGQSRPVQMEQHPTRATDAHILKQAPMRMAGETHPVAVYARDSLAAGHRFAGPAVVAQEDTTCVIPQGIQAHVDGHLNLHLHVKEGQADD
ncbi:MAG: hydantoinase/oxoprolinase family protein [Pseudomonadota bacterium]